MNKKKILIIVCILLLLGGCTGAGDRCNSNSDCKEDELCFDNGDYLHIKHCRKMPTFFEQDKNNESREQDIQNDLNFSNYTITYIGDFGYPKNEVIPNNYIKIIIYESECWCNFYPCDEDDRKCRNYSKSIWINPEDFG